MTNTDANLKLDPSVINNKSQTYTSLTDINGISVFSNDYKNKISTYQANEKLKYTDIKDEVFVKKVSQEDTKLEALKSQIFLNTNTQIIQDTTVNNTDSQALIIPMVGIMVILFLALIMKYLQKKKENRRKYEANIIYYDK